MADRLLTILWPIVLAIVAAILVRFFAKSRAIQLAQWAEFAVLKVLLPLFVIESRRLVNKPADFLLAFVIGFALPCVVLLLGLGLAQRTERFSPDLALMSATFGGGSRGSIIILLLTASSGRMYEYLKWFVFVDLGSFVALLTVLTVWIRRSYRSAASVSIVAGRWRQLLNNYAVITLLVVGVYFAVSAHIPQLEQLMSATQAERKWLFSFLAFFALSLRFQKVRWFSLAYDMLGLWVVRLLAVLSIMVLAVRWIDWTHPVWLVFGVLAAMPPSSLLPAMVAQAGATSQRLAYVNAFSGMMNAVYLLWVGLAILASGFLQ